MIFGPKNLGTPKSSYRPHVFLKGNDGVPDLKNQNMETQIQLAFRCF